jgi:acyl-CoA dehydrogenase
MSVTFAPDTGPDTASETAIVFDRQRATAHAATIAAKHADDVDRKGRFPSEAIDALRSTGLLGALVPHSLGGPGLSLIDVSRTIETLGRACSSAGMIYAMHQIQVACLLHHADTSALQALLGQVAQQQLLLASATTEAAVGGAIRTSLCSVEPFNDDTTKFRFEKQASVISYAAYSDGILATGRRNPQAPASDQSLLYVDTKLSTLEQTGTWNTFGFRGTCSSGQLLRSVGHRDHIFSTPYADISAQTMLPVSHIVWSHLWLGMATEAVSRARAFLRMSARKKRGTTPAGAVPTAALVARLHEMRALVHDAVEYYERVRSQPDARDVLSRASFQIRMNNLKVSGSRQVVEIITDAMEACGMAAYREDTPYSMGRLLRDAHGARVMINNERILSSNADWLLVSKED